ncbi:MAG: ABC transporter ATP-binding protein [Chloroflexota bacterium]|nr:ABC transporter ATP-binding protein [Chloroflexota bacterium]
MVAAGQSRQPLLQAEHLVKRYGDLLAVDDLNLTVFPGEVVGLLGPNGAGKTTSISMCTGLLRPTAGSVIIGGVDLRRDPAAAKQLIGYVPDEPYLYDKLSGREFVTFMAEVYGVRTDVASRREELLTLFDLQDAADDLIGGYSHGMRQKTALAGMLIHEPRLLFLDEPTVGLDPRGARLLKSTLRTLAEEGRSVVLSTHILEIAQAICDRVAIIDHGRLLAEGTLAELRDANGAGGDETLEDIFLRLTGGEEDRTLAQSLLAP